MAVHNGSDCSVSYDVVDEFSGRNVTDKDKAIWPCELLLFWVDIHPFVELVRYLLSYGTSIIIMFGVAGNVLSFIVFTKRQMRMTAQNIYLAVLAVYDTCTLLFNFMIGVMRAGSDDVNRVFQKSEGLCTVHGVVVELFNILSVWILVAFTVERYILFKFPLKYKPSLRNTYITVSVVTVVGALISLHKIAVSGFEGDSVFGYKACKTRRKIFKEIVYLYVAVNTWLPTLLITCVNLVIIRELRLNRRRRDTLTQSIMSASDDKTTKLLLLVSTRYVLLVLPLGIVQTTELIWNGSMAAPTGSSGYIAFMVTKMRLKWTRAFFFFFYQLNFAINFILYMTSSSAKKFQFYLRQVLGLKQSLVEPDVSLTMPSSFQWLPEVLFLKLLHHVFHHVNCVNNKYFFINKNNLCYKKIRKSFLRFEVAVCPADVNICMCLVSFYILFQQICSIKMKMNKWIRCIWLSKIKKCGTVFYVLTFFILKS